MKKKPAPSPSLLIRSELKKHVAAIHIGADLTLVERKMVNILLLNAYEELLTSEFHSIPVPLLCAMLGWDENQDSKHLQAVIKSLARTSVEFNVLENGKESWSAMALISYGEIKGGICTYSYAKFLAQRLYNPDTYATINLRIQRKFRAGYTLALYENCLRFKNVGSTGWWPLETYRILLGATAKLLDEFKYLNRDAISKPVAEINSVSDIRLKPEFRRTGRKVSEIRFLITEAPLQEVLPAPAVDSDIPAIRESVLFKKLRSHGIGERLAIAWIRQDEARARVAVDYVEARAKKGQVKGSTAGYIRTVFESGTEISQPSEFEAGQKAQAAEEAEAKKRDEAEKRRRGRAESSALDQAKAAVLALTPEARRALAAEYRQGEGAAVSATWDEAKSDFRSPMERIPFNLWLQKKFMPTAGEKEKAA